MLRLCVFLQHYFLIVFGHDGQKPLELRTEEETECDEWVEVIQQARYITTIMCMHVYVCVLVLHDIKHN